MFFELRERAQRLQLRVLQLCQLLALGERLRKRLSTDALQLRLVIETLKLRRPTRHAEMDDSLCSHRKIRGVDDALPALFGSGGRGTADEFRLQQSCQRNAAQTVGGAREKRAPIDGQLRGQ